MNLTIQNYREQIDCLLSRYRNNVKTVKREKAVLAEAERHLNDVAETQSIIQVVAQGIQTAVHAKISRIVTRCLQAVFGDRFSFHIDFERKRGKTEARLLFLNHEGEKIDPTEDCAGGVADTASFGLRLAALVLSRPRKRRLLVLDEPFKHLSVSFLPFIRDMLETLSEEMGLQFIIVTHSEELMTGKVVRL